MWDSIIGASSTLLGSALNSANQNRINKDNADLQREFAQNSIQWRIQDAQKAGVHPLAALGASGYNASPSFVAADNGIAQAGQQISQGLARQLEDDLSEKSQLELERAKLENLKLQKEINEMGIQVNPNNIFSPSTTLGSVSNPNVPPGPESPNFPNTGLDERKIFKVSQDLNLAQLGTDSSGKPTFILQPNSDGLLGQILTDGNLITGTIAQVQQFERVRRAIADAERLARKQGLLKDDEQFSRNLLNHRWDGFKLEVIKKPPKSPIISTKDKGSFWRVYK